MKKPVTKLVDINLSELSLVTRGANQHANISITKAADDPATVELTKYLSTADGAKSFTDFMAQNNAQLRVDRIASDMWPVTSALRESLVSILADQSLSDTGKEDKIAESVAQFAATVNPPSQHPDAGGNVVNELLKCLTETKENSNMSEELVKKAEGLEAQVAELTKKFAESEVLAKMTDDEKAYLADLDKEGADEFKAASAADRAKMMKKSADADEVFKSVDGVELRKSAVGEGVFAVLKAQDEALRATRAEMVKAADRALTVEFTKRAEDELSNLPGEAVAKVAVLKGIHGMDEAAQVALNAMLKAGNDALAKGYETFGVVGGKQNLEKADKREAAIKKLRDADPSMSYAAAESAVLSANPDLYEG